MDVVYLQGPDVSEQELRWSLRSVAANLPHERVLFLGQVPDFVTEVDEIHAPWPEQKFYSLHAKHRMLSKLDFEEATVMDDDMYITRPIDRVRNTHTGWLTRPLVAVRSKVVTLWSHAVDISIDFLESVGREDLVKCSVHAPRVVRKDWMRELSMVSSGEVNPWLWRLVYGNVYDEKELLPVDPKATTPELFDTIMSYDIPFLSSEDTTIPIVEDYLNDLFPEKCVYEV